MIISFKDSDTEKVWNREPTKKFSLELQKLAKRRMMWLDAAEILQDLKVPPGNRLEKLLGNREGQHSIRVNDQWRICFVWNNNGASDVEIVDYH